jgi:hypothetical protein
MKINGKIIINGPHIDISGHEVVNINVSTRGGYRPGSGRKKTAEDKQKVTLNLTASAIEILKTKQNKSQYINDLIIQAEKREV